MKRRTALWFSLSVVGVVAVLSGGCPAGPGIFTVYPLALNFGTILTQDTVFISNAGSTPVSWSVSNVPAWVSVAPLSGTTAGGVDTLTVTVLDLTQANPNNDEFFTIITVGAGSFNVYTTAGVPGTDPGDVIYFKDSALESAVRASIFKPLGPLTEADLLLVTNLDGRGLGIRDLSGLEYCLNMTHLNLDTNQIADITPLANLVKLKVLVLDSNHIFDISPLAELRELDTLSLFDNQVADIQALITNAANGGLSEGDILVLDVRHLGEQAVQVHVPVLRNTYGVNIYLVTEGG